MMNETVHRSESHRRILEDLSPFAERLICRDYVELESFFGGLTSKAPEAPVFLNS